MRAWMAIGVAMLIGVGSPDGGRVVPLPVYAAEQAADQAAQVLADMRAALGGAALEEATAIRLEGPFRRAMGERQMEGTLTLVLQAPDRMHKSEDMEFPGGASAERIVAIANGVAWEDVQNRGGMGGGRMMVLRAPGGRPIDEAEMERARTARAAAEMERWMLALLARPAGEVTYAGVAQSPDGSADTLEMKDARGQAVRLFVDQLTHLPLMLTFEEVRPRIMMQGRPVGRRGPGGPGAGAGVPPPSAGGERQRPSEEEIRRRIAEMPPPKPSQVRLSFADFNSVDGVMVPTQITMSVDGTPAEEWTVEKIAVNPSLKADFFEKK